jgi:N-acetylglucosaminyl-diphospho-decaprenol L-rhamnosyltransferase
MATHWLDEPTLPGEASEYMHVHTEKRGAVVIVTYNCAGYIRGCLASLRRVADQWEVITVDNGSRDDTVQVIASEFPWATLIATGANRGFSAANNTGAASATAPWILFLNPDTIVTPGALDRLVAAAAEDKASVIAPRLNEVDGRYQPGSADDRMPTFLSLVLSALLPPAVRPTRLTRQGTGPGGFDPSKPQRIARPMAAAVMIRRDLFQSIGGFDERFHPIWFEDVDLSKRLLEAGYEIWYEPSAVITHVGQHTLTMYNLTAVLAMWNANMIRYARKHMPRQAGILRVIAAFGMLLRALVRAADPRFIRATPGHVRLAWQMIRHSDESRWYDVPRR